MTYKITTIDNHILINSGEGRLLIDTGCPSSFCKEGKITLCGNTETVPDSLMGVDAAYITANVGTEVIGIVGMDFISRHNMAVDLENSILTFDGDRDGWTPVPSGLIMGSPYIEMEICGRPAKVILDTGAKISYISQEYTAGLECTETATDFNPAIGGSFQTPLYEGQAALSGKNFKIRLGHLPSPLDTLRATLGVDGFAGADIFKHFPVLFADGRVWIR